MFTIILSAKHSTRKSDHRSVGRCAVAFHPAITSRPADISNTHFPLVFGGWPGKPDKPPFFGGANDSLKFSGCVADTPSALLVFPPVSAGRFPWFEIPASAPPCDHLRAGSTGSFSDSRPRGTATIRNRT